MSTVPHRDRTCGGRSCLRPGSSLALLLSLSLAAGWPAQRAFAQTANPSPPVAPAATSGTTASPAPPSTPAASAPTVPAAPLAESLQGTARADYAGARILYEDGDYAGAYTKLESAYLASKDPRLLWNMAACEKALRHYASVMNLLERYLKEGGALIGEDERQATRELVETVREFVNELRLDVQPAEGVDIYVDAVKTATTPLAGPLRVDMGRRKLTFRKQGFVPHEAEMDLAGGKSLDLKVQLQVEVHEGVLRIVSDPNSVISIDGHVVGTAQWTGKLASGPHTVHVSAEGKQAYKTDVVVKDGDTSSLHVNLIEDQGPPGLKAESSGPLWWIVGGIALAGAGVGGYFLLNSGDGPAQPSPGTLGGVDL